MPRTGYIAQVGLDFGTAFSKCVVRDIGHGTARVLETSRSVDGTPFLFSSVIGFRNGSLVRTPASYDEALPFAKMLLTALARGDAPSGALLLWQEYLRNLPEGMNQIEGVTLAVAWQLAPILSAAWNLAVKMMPEFGEQSDDCFLVNLCVPVGDMQEHAVMGAFRTALKIAWCMTRFDLPSEATPAHLREFVNSLPNADVDGLCGLYPEVGANVQAFLKSGFAHRHWGIPFFITDVGSGTVDQSFFILSPDLGELTFLAALVHPLGSSEIERRCVTDVGISDAATYSAHLTEIRAYKEGRGSLPSTAAERFNATIELLRSEVAGMTRTCAHAGALLIVPAQFADSVLMNAGGGMRNEPYRKGVQSAFQGNWNLAPETIELPRPNDLLTATGEALPSDWFRRLTVAYGLSFPQQDLHRITLPDAVPPLPTTPDHEAGNDVHHTQGRCRGCGRPAIPGDDYCYSCSG